MVWIPAHRGWVISDRSNRVNQNSNWVDEAYCAGHPDPDLWHYQSSKDKNEWELATWRIAEAKTICNLCPVKDECLAEGMKEENLMSTSLILGAIYGGLMVGERLNIRDKKVTRMYGIERNMLNSANKKMGIISQCETA